MGEERRSFSRITFINDVMVNKDQQKIPGELKNVSLSGMYIVSDVRPPVSDEARPIEITLPLDGKDSFKMLTYARVVRSDDEGFALEFDLGDVSLRSIFLLKNLVTLRSDDPKRIDEEYAKMLEDFELQLWNE